jgi:hypothetical protein
MACLAVLGTSGGGAKAAEHACLIAGPGLSASPRLSGDGASPIGQLISIHPYGGTALANQIRDSIVMNVKHVPEALHLLDKATPAQARSLAMGLGQAASLCVDRRPADARDMQRKVAELGRIEVAQAFEAGSGLSLSTPLRTRSGSCFDGAPPVLPDQVAAFNLAPARILNESPLGGSALSSAVRNLAISDPAIVSTILSLTPSATTLQKSAIGAGLGQAVTACELRDPSVAQIIQRFVAAGGDTELQALFQSVAGGPQTASIGFSGPAAGPVTAGGIASTGPISVGLNAFGASPQFQRQPTFQFVVDPGSISDVRGTTLRTVTIFTSVSP